ncbi:hypothetical protein BC835DRAFT_1410699 [Cytidiella melzeri]|nr:hypothetical protein BC835DRAFT_1410699 [Cytidiella melzeri]
MNSFYMGQTEFTTPHPQFPERSRNAIAQAKYREKRKAYVHQLERTVAVLRLELSTATQTQCNAARREQILDARTRDLEYQNISLKRAVHNLRQRVERYATHGFVEPKQKPSDPSFGEYHARNRVTADPNLLVRPRTGSYQAQKSTADSHTVDHPPQSSPIKPAVVSYGYEEPKTCDQRYHCSTHLQMTAPSTTDFSSHRAPEFPTPSSVENRLHYSSSSLALAPPKRSEQ